MSESISVTGVSTPVTIYGTFNAAKDYVAVMYGAAYAAWTALTDDQKKQTLIAALRYLEQQAWDADTAADFATRDAIAAFPQAEYELAVLIADDASMTQNADASSNIRAVGAGSARVEFFNPTSVQSGTASVLPPIVMRLVGQYLAAATVGVGASGQSGDCENPFSRCADFDRKVPY
jgi:hypothetical protein